MYFVDLIITIKHVIFIVFTVCKLLYYYTIIHISMLTNHSTTDHLKIIILLILH